MILTDDVKFRLRFLKDEKELEGMVEEHAKEIFGEHCIYLNLKRKLASKSGIVSIPDGYVIKLSKPYEWYIVEAELSSHSVHEHIVAQLSKFLNGISSYETRKQLVEWFYNVIREDDALRTQIQGEIGHEEIHHFLTQIVSSSPRVVVIIDKNDVVEEACQALKVPVETIEFKTYIGESGSPIHAHWFRPLYEEKAIIVVGHPPRTEPPSEGGSGCWLTPVDDSDWELTKNEMQRLVRKDQEYIIAGSTPDIKYIDPDDMICFYASRRGVIAHAKVASFADLRWESWADRADKSCWVFRLKEVELYLDDPVVLDDELRGQLDAFQGRDPKRKWEWFAKVTRIINRHDFDLLTRQQTRRKE